MTKDDPWEKAIKDQKQKVIDERIKRYSAPKPKITDEEKKQFIERVFGSEIKNKTYLKYGDELWNKLKRMYIMRSTHYGFDSECEDEYHVDETEMVMFYKMDYGK